MAGCRNRKYRLVDQWRGYRCDGAGGMEAFERDGMLHHGREQPEPLFSNADTFFTVEKRGDRYKVLETNNPPNRTLY